MFEIFEQGGFWGMSLLTLNFIAVFLAAWKAPRWVLGIGGIAFPLALILQLVGVYNGYKLLSSTGDISVGLLYGAWSTMMIPLIYSLIIFVVSLVIYLLQRARI